MYSVYQHWDPLKVCVVGCSYPPEYYSWIKDSYVRQLFERIAIETEEDFQQIIKKLKEFNVEVLRPDMPELVLGPNGYLKPPQVPRDYMVMVGNKLYENYRFNFKRFYLDVKASTWPDCSTYEEFLTLPQWIQDECNDVHQLNRYVKFYSAYDKIYQQVEQQGNQIISHFYDSDVVNGAMISRIGRDLFFGTKTLDDRIDMHQRVFDAEFTDTRNHIVNTGGHADGSFCPVAPGLIISLNDEALYSKTFPGWEVIYLPGQSWEAVDSFIKLKEKNQGKWWIPGFEQNQVVIDTVETWLKEWVGYVEETVFDVNMLIIDPKNVMVFNYNKQVFDALDRYGITPHIVPFRHRYFWDGGIHCVTADLNRTGTMQDFFK